MGRLILLQEQSSDVIDDLELSDEQVNEHIYQWDDESFQHLFFSDGDSLSEYEEHLKGLLILFYFPNRSQDDVRPKIISEKGFEISAANLMKRVLKNYRDLALEMSAQNEYGKKFFLTAGISSAQISRNAFWEVVNAVEPRNDWNMTEQKFKNLNPVAKLLYLFFLINLFKKHIAEADDVESWEHLISEWELGLFPTYFLHSFSLNSLVYQGLDALGVYDKD